MSYDPLFDAAQKAVDDVLGEGEYGRLNRDNPGVPKELRAKSKRKNPDVLHIESDGRVGSYTVPSQKLDIRTLIPWSDDINPATIPDAVIASENARRNARKRQSYTGGAVWAKHNPNVRNCRCKRCNGGRAVRKALRDTK